MAEDDIYKSKGKYLRFVDRLDHLAVPADQREYRQAKYHCRNPENLEHFRALSKIFEARDTSYVRRLRLMNILLVAVFVTEKNLEVCARDDLNEIAAYAHSVMRTTDSKSCFIKGLRFIWKQLFPELDRHGRPDETIVPYVVRHLSVRVDKSRQRRRGDRLTAFEFKRLVQAFSLDRRMQALVTLAHESLCRPQELLYVRVRDVELHDNYGKVWISEHGKEGTGFLQCIDSYPYVAAWLNDHPLRHQSSAFFFCNVGNANKYGQMRPEAVNKHLREKCQLVGIRKPITGYSLKRNGVTFRRLRGDSDVVIQHAARWTSTKQLRTYDQSEPDDAFRQELRKRKLLKDQRDNPVNLEAKTCTFCQTVNGLADTCCRTCKRLLDRSKYEAEAAAIARVMAERDRICDQFDEMRKEFADINQFMNNLVAANPSLVGIMAAMASETERTRPTHREIERAG